MKIERDAAAVTAGVRHGRTLGGPIALQVANRDYANWEERMSPWPVADGAHPISEVHLPRPGHADLVGTWKYKQSDVRNILERASARETAARVAGGALAKAFLRGARCRRSARTSSRSPPCAPPSPRRRSSSRTSPRSTTPRCAASTPRPRARWSPRSTPCARPTSRSAGSSRCRPSASRPASARTSPGRSASTGAWRWRSSRSRR